MLALRKKAARSKGRRYRGRENSGREEGEVSFLYYRPNWARGEKIGTDSLGKERLKWERGETTLEGKLKKTGNKKEMCSTRRGEGLISDL